MPSEAQPPQTTVVPVGTVRCAPPSISTGSATACGGRASTSTSEMSGSGCGGTDFCTGVDVGSGVATGGAAVRASITLLAAVALPASVSTLATVATAVGVTGCGAGSESELNARQDVQAIISTLSVRRKTTSLIEVAPGS